MIFLLFQVSLREKSMPGIGHLGHHFHAHHLRAEVRRADPFLGCSSAGGEVLKVN